MEHLSDLSAKVRAATLDGRPIGEVVASVRNEQVAEFVSYLADHVGVATLGSFVAHEEANRLFDRALVPTMRQAVLAELDRWVEHPNDEVWRWDVAAFHAAMTPLTKPPTVWRDLEKWAYKNDVLGVLDAPAAGASGLVDSKNAWYLTEALRGTIGELARGSRIRYKAAEETGRNMAHGYLMWSVRRKALLARRETTWSTRPAEPVLRKLGHRLREAMRELGDESERPVLPASPLLITQMPPAASAAFTTADGPQTVIVDFAGFEDLPLRVDPETNAAEQRVVIEWTLDAIHDPDSPLRPALLTLLSRPSWARLLDGVETLAARAAASEVPAYRVAYRVTPTSEEPITDVELECVLQKRGKTGKWSAGAITAPSKLIDHEASTDRDATAIDLLALAENPQLPPSKIAPLYAAALRELAGHPRITLGRTKQRITVREVTPTVALEPFGGGHRLVARVGDAEIRKHQDREFVVAFEDNLVLVAPILPKVAAFLDEVRAHRAILPKEAHDRALGVLPALQPEVGLVIPAALRGEARASRSDVVLRLTPEEDGLRVALGVRPVPGGPFWPPGTGPVTAFGSDGATRIFATRHLDEEKDAARALTDAIGLPPGPKHRIDSLERALDLLAELQARTDATIEWPEGQRAWRVGTASDLRVRVKRAGEWFGVEGDVEVDGKTVPLINLLKAVRNGDRYVRVGKGRFARISDDLRARLAEASDSLVVDKGEVQVGLTSASVIDSLGVVEADDAWRDVITRVQAADDLQPTLPETLDAELRDYQREGFEWLARLASWGAGACLADEMGLGKTVQALALLLHRRDEGPALVVAPTSVGQGWEAEAKRFAPSLDVRMYRGRGREEMLEGIGPGTLLVTSYDVLARDAERLAEIELGTLVLDEAQAIKNARTRRAKGARSLNARWRLALTGTPLENHLGELWSIYRTVSPGLLGPWEHFRRHFANPIERDGDDAARLKLAGRLRPFLLRRTKGEVARELPPRTEVVLPVELTERERALYDAARDEAVAGLSGGGGGGGERFSVLAAITRLRRIACHPRLVLPKWRGSSAKLDAFLELSESLIEEGHRALVFSQFTSHLAIVREALDFRGVETLYLDGSTPATARGGLVEKWQTGDEPLFLISLKAGGTGLNLTAADYVVHLDPWWNPAVEDQASDRAHRIGQDKPVTVVRLVAQDTIEEKVLALHAQKRDLADALLAGGETAASLSVHELSALIVE